MFVFVNKRQIKELLQTEISLSDCGDHVCLFSLPKGKNITNYNKLIFPLLTCLVTVIFSQENHKDSSESIKEHSC